MKGKDAIRRNFFGQQTQIPQGGAKDTLFQATDFVCLLVFLCQNLFVGPCLQIITKRQKTEAKIIQFQNDLRSAEHFWYST